MCAIEAPDTDDGTGGGISDKELRKELYNFLDKLCLKKDVLIIPPDYTRFHSQAGKITQMIAEYYRVIPIPTTTDNDRPNDITTDNFTTTSVPKFQIMPALGTHAPMTPTELASMYGTALAEKQVSYGCNGSTSPFLVHKWRTDVTTIGYVDAKMVEVATYGMVKDTPWPAQLNNLVWSKRQTTPEPRQSSTTDDENQNLNRSSTNLVISIGQVSLD